MLYVFIFFIIFCLCWIFWRIITYYPDPVKECKTYKEHGCPYVDGPYCPFPNECSFNKNIE